MQASDYFIIAFAPGAGLLFLFVFLYANHILEPAIKQIFVLLAGLELLELVAYCLELWTAGFQHPTMLRVLLSAIGYSVRPVLFYLILLLNGRNDKRKRVRALLAVPAVVCILMGFSAFFTDIAYSYTATNEFVRGPLGLTTHVVLLFYVLYILVSAFQNLHKRRRLEFTVVVLIVGFLLSSVILEEAYSIHSVGRTAIVLSTVFYYMFFQTQSYHHSMEEDERIRKELEHASKLDSVTGLLNKQAFLEELEKMAAACTQGGAVMFVDLDHFKQVNDKLGHLCGDEAVRDAAQRLSRVFRKADILSRFGGDEFCAFLPNISKYALYARLEETIRILRAEYADENETVKVTASIGAVYFEGECAAQGIHLIRLADVAVYEAKNGGRDRYVIKNIEDFENETNG